jgi:hypothetical protein
LSMPLASTTVPCRLLAMRVDCEHAKETRTHGAGTIDPAKLTCSAEVAARGTLCARMEPVRPKRVDHAVAPGGAGYYAR